MTRKQLTDHLQFMLDWAHGARERHGVDELDGLGLVVDYIDVSKEQAAGQVLTISPRIARLIVEYLKETA